VSLTNNILCPEQQANVVFYSYYFFRKDEQEQHPQADHPPGNHPKGHLSTGHYSQVAYSTYTVKKVSAFPVPSGDVTNQTLPGSV
jgi:hypothetical protein